MTHPQELSRSRKDSHRLNLVSALNCEAKALVDFFRLRKKADKPFSVFGGDYSFSHKGQPLMVEVTVLISGIGALNMATAVGWLAANQDSSKHTVWLNVGIAGHGSFDIGEGFILNATQDLFSQRQYFPPQVAKRPVKTSACMSLNAPSTDYPENGAIDMEASAFFNAATRFTDAELVQSFKVVSDTPDHSIENLNAQLIQSLMQEQTPNVQAYLNALLGLASSKPRANLLSDLPDLKATHSQRQQFTDKIQRLAYMMSADKMRSLEGKITQSNDIKEVLSLLSSELEQLVPSLKTVEV